MRHLLRRWWLWLGAFVILGLFSTGFTLTLIGQSGINRANFDRIQVGMEKDEVDHILGRDARASAVASIGHTIFDFYSWDDGPSWVHVKFVDGKMEEKRLHMATTWERLRWPYRQWLEKLGL